jgi:hypothetical protein
VRLPSAIGTTSARSSNEDPLPEPSWSGYVATKVSSSWRSPAAARNKNVVSRSRPVARSAREDQRTVRPRVAPSRTGASESQGATPCQADPPGAVGGVTGSRPPIFRRFRPPWLGLTVEASVASEIDGLGVDTECAAGSGFRRRSAAPKVITHPGRRSPRCSCFPRRRRVPRINPAIEEAGGSVPEQLGSAMPPLRRQIKAEQPPSW